MTDAPLIGVTTSATVDRGPERAFVNAAYLRAVQAAGGVPILLPPQLDGVGLDALWSRLGGLLLTGGGDIDPARFGEARHPATCEVVPERDALEIALVERAVAARRPLLAVCRGIQVLAVALGGTLYQDLPQELGGPIAHAQKKPRVEPTHAVRVDAGSRLARVLGATEVFVNSLHHQAIKTAGRGLRVVAHAPDGVVEGVEGTEPDAFVLGVQWHPEDLAERDPAARALFRALVDAARREPLT